MKKLLDLEDNLLYRESFENGGVGLWRERVLSERVISTREGRREDWKNEMKIEFKCVLGGINTDSRAENLRRRLKPRERRARSIFK